MRAQRDRRETTTLLSSIRDNLDLVPYRVHAHHGLEAHESPEGRDLLGILDSMEEEKKEGMDIQKHHAPIARQAQAWEMPCRECIEHVIERLKDTRSS